MSNMKEQVLFIPLSTLENWQQFISMPRDNAFLYIFFQLKVLPKDLQLCTERSSGVDSMGQHQWGDMVQLE